MNYLPSMFQTLTLLSVLLAAINSCEAFHISSSRGEARIFTSSASNDSRLFAGVLTPVREPTRILEDDTWLEEDDDDDDFDDLVDSLTQELEEMEGLWYSDDFYGSHGREWVQVSARLVGASATSAMVAVKVTGDLHVPAGCVTWQTKSWPTEQGPGVAAEIQVRANPNDPDGFSWLPGELNLINRKQIQLVCHYSASMKNVGTFYKQEDEDDDAGFA